jgi:ring-1,2-phenylacetyl-CoA epoxidase subunit PaaE
LITSSLIDDFQPRMSTPHFHSLYVKRIEPLTQEAAQITFAIPPELRNSFAFQSGQFLTLRAMIGGQAVRRSYSVCSTPAQLAASQEISVGIKRVEGGVFSSWVTRSLQTGDQLDVMPPDGRFTSRQPQAKHRLGIAAGSGITPIVSMIAHHLAAEPQSHFTLIYGNQRTSTIMFGEALQDLKDRYPGRLQLIHILSRQATELALNHGRIDAAKLTEITSGLVDLKQIDEAFICGPEAMIEAAEQALQSNGMPRERIHSERFASGVNSGVNSNAIKNIAVSAVFMPTNGLKSSQNALEHQLDVVLDGKTHSMRMAAQDNVLDVALDAGLDLPYACKGGVCCTCRAKVLEGRVEMHKNFTLEQWEIDKGFVLTCQARCKTARVVVSYDER